MNTKNWVEHYKKTKTSQQFLVEKRHRSAAAIAGAMRDSLVCVLTVSDGEDDEESSEKWMMSNLHLCLLLSFFLDFSLATKDDTEDPIFLAEQSIVFFHSFYFRRKARLVFPVESYRPLDYSSSF